jgi:carbonic anhydrase
MASSFLSKVLLSVISLELVLAQIKYAVYYDDASSYNPLGAGYKPRSPNKWKQISPNSWPIFLDWGKQLQDPRKWNKGNTCVNMSNKSYNTSHNQSPIKLTSDKLCIDRHEMIVNEVGICQKNQAKFNTTAYGLAVDLTSCTKTALLDHSRNEDQWYLKEIVIKYPSEHTIGDQKFDAELQINFAGSNDGYDPTTSHKERIAITGVLLAGKDGAYDAELQLLLDGWDNAMGEAYASCGKVYDHAKCVLTSASRRKLEPREIKVTSVSTSEDHHVRHLKASPYGRFHRQCRGSFYCFFNLYLHTKTDFYYKYLGSLTYPPCTENVDWRVLQNPLYVAPSQIEQIKRLTYMYLNSKCELGTVGVKLNDGCAVGVNRPLQSLSTRHDLKKCDAWVPKSVNATGPSITTNNVTSFSERTKTN